MLDVHRRPSHHTWLCFDRLVPPEAGRVMLRMTTHAHSFMHIRSGSLCGRSRCGRAELPLEGEPGSVLFLPADGEELFLEGVVGRNGVGFSVLIVPDETFEAIRSSQGLVRRPEWRAQVWQRDTVLQRSLRALTCTCSCDDGLCEDREEAACSLVLRAAELLGAGMPDWHADLSHFSSPILDHLVATIDSKLKVPPTAGNLATLVGLSPGHFSRKFRNTTGLSLHRFINRRRIRGALSLLQDHSRPLAHVAIDLGFSSQSHFTRLFSDLTGMTPSRYQKQFRRIRA